MTGWTLIVRARSGRGARPIRLGFSTVAGLVAGLLLVLGIAAAIGWGLGERQAQSALHGAGS